MEKIGAAQNRENHDGSNPAFSALCVALHFPGPGGVSQENRQRTPLRGAL